MEYKKLIKNINKFDREYLKTLLKYSKPTDKISHYDGVISAKKFEDLKWKTIIEINDLSDNIGLLKLPSIWCNVPEEWFHDKNILEIFGLINFINSERSRLSEFITKEFTDKPTDDERMAGIKHLDKYSILILAENIAKDFNIKIDDVFERKYSEIISKQLYYRDKNRYELKLRQIYLDKNK